MVAATGVIAAAGVGACTEATPPASVAAPAPVHDGLPHARAHVRIADDAPTISLSPDALTIGDAQLATVGDDGLREATHHRVDALHRYFGGVDPGVQVALRADADASFGAVIDVLYTASEADRRQLVMAVSGEPRAGIPMFGGSMWDRTYDERVYEHACTTYVRLADASVQIEPCAGESMTVGAADAAALAAAGKRLLDDGFVEVLLVEAPASTRWGTVVAIVDALATDGCAGPDEPRSSTCERWHVGIDLSPPLPWYAGDWGALEVSIYEIASPLWYGHAKRYTEPALRKRVEKLLPALRTCLRDAPGLRIRMPRCIDVQLTKERPGREVSFVWQPGAPACLTDLFAPASDRSPWDLLADAEIRLAVTYPAPEGAAADRACTPIPRGPL